jgi:hypothetical protein
MEALLALALGLVVGLSVGFIAGAGWTGSIVGRAVRREIDAGRLDRSIAERIVDLRRT